LMLMVVGLMFCALTPTVLAEQKNTDDDNILFVVASDTIPESRYEGVSVFLPVNKVSLFEISENYADKREKVKKVIILHETVKKLTSDEELTLKDFLLRRFEEGKEIWVVGNNIPDNFLQLWLGIERKTRTFRISYADFQLANGLWKNEEHATGSNVHSPQLLSLSEILKAIKETNR
jgi:hypothetical protein